MEKTQDWQGLPYYPISQFYSKKFGGKVSKLPVSVAGSCPNREGLRGMETCIFCDKHGSAAYPESRELELRRQIEENRLKINSGKHSGKCLIYFQAYTNTFMKVAKLREQFEVASQFDDVVGVVIGTRPDCISETLFELLNEYSERYFISVELGVQSFQDEALEWMKRGHSAERSIKAINKLRLKCPHLDLGVHLMFGWPMETHEHVLEAAKICSKLPIDNVKLHNLHVLKETELEMRYLNKEFKLINRSEYAQRVTLFLQNLRPDIAVHRLAASASRWDELVAPIWVRNRMENYQYIVDWMRRDETFQGHKYEG